MLQSDKCLTMDGGDLLCVTDVSGSLASFMKLTLVYVSVVPKPELNGFKRRSYFSISG